MSSPIPASPAPHPWLRVERCIVLLAGLALGLILLDFPQAYNQSIDAGWQVALVDAHYHRRQFGSEVAFTFGPWGWLLSHFYPEVGLAAKTAWEIGAKMAMAFALIAISIRWSVARRWYFLLLSLLLLGLFADTVFVLFIALAVLNWLIPGRGAHRGALLVTAVLAFLAVTKFTYTVLIVAGVLSAISSRLWIRDWRGACTIGGAFVVMFLAAWLAAGQKLAALPVWLTLSGEVSSGYPQAMNFVETNPVFYSGIAVMALTGLQVVWGLRRRMDWRSAGPALAFLLVALFLAWKHGFVRADGHTIGFFAFAALFSLAWPQSLPASFRAPWAWAIPLCCLLGCRYADPGLFRVLGANARQRLTVSAQLLLQPVRRHADFLAAQAASDRELALPGARALIGSHSVDLLVDEQVYLFANHLRYDPRPVPQSYSTYTPGLLERNAAFYRSASAPEFVLLQYSSLDYRFPTEGDSVLLAELPLRYRIVADQETCLVLARRPRAPTLPMQRELINSSRPDFGVEVPLPGQRDHALWLQADFPLSLLGRLRALLYRPPILQMTVTDDAGTQTQHRMVPEIARDGFLIQPYLATQDDYAGFVRGRGNRWLRSLRLDPAPGEQRWWGRPSLRFFRLPELPVTAASALDLVVERGIANLVPARIFSAVGTEVFPAGGRWALMVHAPGEIDFEPTTAPKHVAGSFGLRAGSYTGSGHTDGVEFSIDLIDAAGKTRTAWHRFLAPVTEPGDRGPQAFAVDLSDRGIVRIVFRTEVSPSGNDNWDWSYWTNLRLFP